RSLAVRTVSPYGTDMAPTIGGDSDRSQSHFDADQIEAMAGCAELINSGRAAEGDPLSTVRAIQSFADRYAFAGPPADRADIGLLQAYRAQLDEIAVACEAGAIDHAIGLLNALL